MKYIFTLGVCLLTLISMDAQQSLHLRFRPEQGASSLYQPAYLGWNDSSKIEFGAEVFNRLESNTLNRENIFLSGLTLDEALKTRIVDDLGEDNRLRLGLGGQAIIAFQTKKLPISIHYSIRQELFARIPNAQTVELALFGNKRFEGTRVDDQNIEAKVANINEVGIGTAFDLGKLNLGLRLEYYFAPTGVFINDLSYDLFTDQLGSAIDLAGDYDAIIAGNDGLGGMGGGIDLGVVYEASPKLRIQASILDLGFINWNGEILQKSFNLTYEGEEILDLESFIDAQNLDGINDLVDQILPDTTTGNQNIPVNSTYHFGVEYALSSKDQLQLSVLGSTQLAGGGRPNPIVNLTYQRSLYKEIYIGVNGFWGGLDGWGIGAMISGNFELGNNQLQLFGQASNLLGVIAPTSFGGSMVSAGIGYRLVE